MSYVRQIIYLIIYFRYFRNCLVLSICWDIRICSCWLLHFTPLFSRIQAVRLPLCFLVLSGCSPLFVLSAYHESHSFSQPATTVTVSLSLSAMWPASQYSNTHTHTHTHTHTQSAFLYSRCTTELLDSAQSHWRCYPLSLHPLSLSHTNTYIILKIRIDILIIIWKYLDLMITYIQNY